MALLLGLLQVPGGRGVLPSMRFCSPVTLTCAPIATAHLHGDSKALLLCPRLNVQAGKPAQVAQGEWVTALTSPQGK